MKSDKNVFWLNCQYTLKTIFICLSHFIKINWAVVNMSNTAVEFRTQQIVCSHLTPLLVASTVTPNISLSALPTSGIISEVLIWYRSDLIWSDWFEPWLFLQSSHFPNDNFGSACCLPHSVTVSSVNHISQVSPPSGALRDRPLNNHLSGLAFVHFLFYSGVDTDANTTFLLSSSNSPSGSLTVPDWLDLKCVGKTCN